MSNKRTMPDFPWYSAESARLGLKSPRCPFASAHSCPRYYQSLSLLGGAGCTAIPKTEEETLEAKWKRHALWPITGEQTTGISGGNEGKDAYHKFCPEVAFDTFGLFATFLGRHVGELDSEMAASRLDNEGASYDDPRRIWAYITPQHYSECPLYSPLSHDWVKHITRQAVSANVSPNSGARFDVFISHASEDKDDFVRPLAAELARLGLKVWYDEWTLELGDSLRKKIDEGLANSEYGVVVLSHSFFDKNWPLTELDGLFAREMVGPKVILPVWHDITKEEVLAHSPMLAGKLAAVTAKGVEAVATEIFGVVRPSSPPPTPRVSTSAKTATASKSKIHKGGKFAVELGKRHRRVREKILGINTRRMADFYGFEKAAQLEACECGEDEFPTAAIKKLRDFFFVSREYLEGEDQQVFETFEVTASADDCRKFLGEGFEPFLLCLNEDRENLWCWPVFHKEQDGFDRIIIANSHGYFASMGGGKSNIMHLIEAAYGHGLRPYDVCVQRADRKVWDKLKDGTFYQKGLGGLRGPDTDGQDCFLAWWDEFVSKHK